METIEIVIYTLLAIILGGLIITFLSGWDAGSTYEVLLSFDTELVDTPAQVETILDTLEAHNVSATFFIMGEFAQTHPWLVKRIAVRNEVACHSMSHPWLPKLDDDKLHEEIAGCKRVVENITGKPVLGFRAPYNMIDFRAFQAIDEAGYRYDASLFSYQWAPFTEIPVSAIGLLPAEDYLFTYLNPCKQCGWWLLRNIPGRRVSILFHPRFATTGLDRLIDAYQELGATFLTHEQALEQKA